MTRFVASVQPMGKPRMTRADKWKERPCVMAYRAWCDALRAAAPPLPDDPQVVEVTAYFEMPASWGRKKRVEMKGRPHRVRPDGDNILKGVCDALFTEDSMIYEMRVVKKWDDGCGPRVVVKVNGGESRYD